MKYFICIFLLVSFLGACSSKQGSSSTSQHTHSASQKKEVWTCPMHSQIRKDHPGQCPICGMTLVKVVDEADSGHADQIPQQHAAIQLSSDRTQMIGVKFGVAEKKNLFKKIRVAGRLAFDPELYTAQNEYVEAIRQYERVKNSPLADVRHSAERMVKSSKLRLKVLGLSDRQIEQIGISENSSANLLIHRAGQPVWVYAEIYEMDLPLVRAGLNAEITAGFLGGQKLHGRVMSVDRVINPSTRTAKARIQVDRGSTLLRPESYVDVSIQVPLGEQVTVPFDAVLDTGSEAWVFVADDQGKYTPRLVSIKFYANDEVAIGSGLSGGERIVTSANFLIDSESRLKGVSAKPVCPKDQHWDFPMAMCMPD